MKQLKNNQGFSLLEVIIALSMLGVVSLVFLQLFRAASQSGGGLDISSTGTREVRCLGGYKFVTSYGGKTEQILNEHGGGVKCE